MSHFNFQQAHFLTSAFSLQQAPADIGREIAFAGRSNCGKSSAINALSRQRKLVRTSKTPGRTQSLNFITLDDHSRLVDLPGYGFAKVSGTIKQDWQKLMSMYLNARQSLYGLVVLMDIRHPLKDFDTQMLEWSRKRDLKCHIVLTKSDKLKSAAMRNQIRSVQAFLDANHFPASLQGFSALKKQGINELQETLWKWLNYK